MLKDLFVAICLVGLFGLALAAQTPPPPASQPPASQPPSSQPSMPPAQPQMPAQRPHMPRIDTALVHADVHYWKVVGNDTTFHQTSIDMTRYDKGIIRAKVDGKWQDFPVRELPRAFLEWSFAGRHNYIQILRDTNAMPPLAGPHNGMVASHGLGRKDSKLTINNAVKGMGFLPTKEKLPEMLRLLKTTWNDPMSRKLDILDSLYTSCQDNYDKTMLVSLELYSKPSFETHSFLNEMTDPGVSIVFLDMPSFEVRAIAQLLHPKDPQLSDYEKQVVDWINTVHDYFHGEMPWRSIAVVYHVTEVFDNSPGMMKGIRIVPSMP